jgi:general stress protein 26
MWGPELTDFLEEPRYGTVSTTRPDGRPHATPAAFRHRAGRLYLPTEAGAARLRNLRDEPSLSLIVAEGAGERHVMVLVEGEIMIHEDPEPILAAWLRDAWGRAYGTELDWAERIIEVVPTRVFSYAATGRS